MLRKHQEVREEAGLLPGNDLLVASRHVIQLKNKQLIN